MTHGSSSFSIYHDANWVLWRIKFLFRVTIILFAGENFPIHQSQAKFAGQKETKPVSLVFIAIIWGRGNVQLPPHSLLDIMG